MSKNTPAQRWLHSNLRAIRLENGKGKNKGTVSQRVAGLIPAIVLCDENLKPIVSDDNEYKHRYLTIRIPADSIHADGCDILSGFVCVDTFAPSKESAANNHSDLLYPMGERDVVAKEQSDAHANLASKKSALEAMLAEIEAAKARCMLADQAIASRAK